MVDFTTALHVRNSVDIDRDEEFFIDEKHLLGNNIYIFSEQIEHAIHRKNDPTYGLLKDPFKFAYRMTQCNKPVVRAFKYKNFKGKMKIKWLQYRFFMNQFEFKQVFSGSTLSYAGLKPCPDCMRILGIKRTTQTTLSHHFKE